MLCYLGVGSNLGNRLEHIKTALALLKQSEGIKVLRASPIYETQAQGGPQGQGDFLNLVLEVDCGICARELLVLLKSIEERAGRQPGPLRWTAREIDLDILLCGDLVVKEADLVIPHPAMHQRVFVLKPLADLAPYARHPVLNTDVATLLETGKEERIRKIEETLPLD